MFDADRIYYQRDESTGAAGWYSDTREKILGPFNTKEIAKTALQSHLRYCREHQLDGGRQQGPR